jgi:hypothetical protein
VKKTLLLIGGLLLGARVEASCEKPYMSADIVIDLGTLAVSLRDLDQASYDISAQRLEAGLECIREPLPPLVFASAYRYIGTYYYFQDDVPTAERWLRVSLEIDPGFSWDINELNESHPLRGVMARARNDAQDGPVLLEGMELNTPSGSTLYLDGRKLTRPALTTNRPHLLQVVAENDKSVRQVMLIDGNAIPERFLVAQGSTGPAESSDGSGDSSSGEEEDLFKVTTIQRVRPKAKTPLLLAGGATGLAAGGFYLLSSRFRDDFESAQTSADLEQNAKMTNVMVIVSGVTLAAGLGVEFAGIRLGWTGAGVSIGRAL